jgi:hypothetical protein
MFSKCALEHTKMKLEVFTLMQKMFCSLHAFRLKYVLHGFKYISNEREDWDLIAVTQ